MKKYISILLILFLFVFFKFSYVFAQSTMTYSVSGNILNNNGHLVWLEIDEQISEGYYITLSDFPTYAGYTVNNLTPGSTYFIQLAYAEDLLPYYSNPPGLYHFDPVEIRFNFSGTQNHTLGDFTCVYSFSIRGHVKDELGNAVMENVVEMDINDSPYFVNPFDIIEGSYIVLADSGTSFTITPTLVFPEFRPYYTFIPSSMTYSNFSGSISSQDFIAVLPSPITDLTIIDCSSGSVRLNWTVPSDFLYSVGSYELSYSSTVAID